MSFIFQPASASAVPRPLGIVIWNGVGVLKTFRFNESALSHRKHCRERLIQSLQHSDPPKKGRAGVESSVSDAHPYSGLALRALKEGPARAGPRSSLQWVAGRHCSPTLDPYPSPAN